MREQADTAGTPCPESLPTPLNGTLAVRVSLLSSKNLVGWVSARPGRTWPALTEDNKVPVHTKLPTGVEAAGQARHCPKDVSSLPEMLLKRKLMHVLIEDDKADFTQGVGEH